MQVYLSEALYAEAKSRELPVSELLQAAIRIEVQRRRLAETGEEYLAELLAEVGEPDPSQTAWAQELARQLARRAERVAG